MSTVKSKFSFSLFILIAFMAVIATVLVGLRLSSR